MFGQVWTSLDHLIGFILFYSILFRFIQILDNNRQVWASLDHYLPFYSSLNRFRHVYTSLDKFGLV